MGTLFVDKLDPQSGTSLELGSSGDTVSVNTGATTNLAGNVTLGASGKSITVPSGCTITNNGTQVGFGGTNDSLFRATKGGQSFSNNVWTKVTFNGETFDADGVFDLSNERFTAPSNGKYRLTANMLFESHGGTGDAYHLRYTKNGSSNLNFTYHDNGNYSVLDNWSLMIDDVISLSTNDYIELYAKTTVDNGTDGYISGGSSYSWWCGYKLIT